MGNTKGSYTRELYVAYLDALRLEKEKRAEEDFVQSGLSVLASSLHWKLHSHSRTAKNQA